MWVRPLARTITLFQGKWERMIQNRSVSYEAELRCRSSLMIQSKNADESQLRCTEELRPRLDVNLESGSLTDYNTILTDALAAPTQSHHQSCHCQSYLGTIGKSSGLYFEEQQAL